MRTHLNARKAARQIERRDPQGAAQYRAELAYFHYRPRAVLAVLGDYYDGTRPLPAIPGAQRLYVLP
ncbi:MULTISPECIES: hypothetical protein [Streptomyces rochei group]|uniref:hypothetical protein n=1 Tax=Streptomyces rochei group TaxID=2867164 RepID=UPI0018771090|nr:hypothetical protein [Streptomyces vinaceusdrappus]GHC28897.1 hypothetical protein GCM10010308_52730 [Streptomyces vinaceusdrappus]